MSASPKVYVDTNVYKFSATALPGFRPRQVTSNWGGRRSVVTVYDPFVENPNDRIDNAELKAETALLPEVAARAKAGRVTFVENTETWIEAMFLPKMVSETGYFYGAQVLKVPAPVEYSRVLFGGLEEPSEAQFNFLCKLKEERFLTLQRITGAYQGPGRPLNRNQLLDAFHLWCAEYNRCEYFLSLDFKLAKIVALSKQKPAVSIIRPSGLLAATR